MRKKRVGGGVRVGSVKVRGCLVVPSTVKVELRRLLSQSKRLSVYSTLVGPAGFAGEAEDGLAIGGYAGSLGFDLRCSFGNGPGIVVGDEHPVVAEFCEFSFGVGRGGGEKPFVGDGTEVAGSQRSGEGLVGEEGGGLVGEVDHSAPSVGGKVDSEDVAEDLAEVEIESGVVEGGAVVAPQAKGAAELVTELEGGEVVAGGVVEGEKEIVVVAIVRFLDADDGVDLDGGGEVGVRREAKRASYCDERTSRLRDAEKGGLAETKDYFGIDAVNADANAVALPLLLSDPLIRAHTKALEVGRVKQSCSAGTQGAGQEEADSGESKLETKTGKATGHGSDSSKEGMTSC